MVYGRRAAQHAWARGLRGGAALPDCRRARSALYRHL